MADVAVIKEIQVQLVWDNYQEDKGARASEPSANLRWRWYLSGAIGAVAAVVGLIQARVR